MENEQKVIERERERERECVCLFAGLYNRDKKIKLFTVQILPASTG